MPSFCCFSSQPHKVYLLLTSITAYARPTKNELRTFKFSSIRLCTASFYNLASHVPAREKLRRGLLCPHPLTPRQANLTFRRKNLVVTKGEFLGRLRSLVHIIELKCRVPQNRHWGNRKTARITSMLWAHVSSDPHLPSGDDGETRRAALAFRSF